MKKILYLLLALAVLLAMVSCAQEPENPPVPGPGEKEYSIGEVGPAGGWVFYDKGYYSDGWRYPEAAPGIAGKTAWGESGNYGTGVGIGCGKTNTNAMPQYRGSAKSAATLCLEYSIETDGVTYDDWFLPSFEELKVLYMALRCPGGDNHGPRCPDKTHAKTSNTQSMSAYQNDYCWSSSENGSTNARNISFSNGQVCDADNRMYGGNAIPVRAF